MKNILFLTILITLFSTSTYSQDLITFKDGSVKSVNVKEISETELKYQKIENSSVIYSILKTSLFSVQFKNGEKEVFNQPAPAIVVTQLIDPQTKKEAIIEKPKVQKPQPSVSVRIPDIYTPKPAMITFKDGTVRSVTIKDITDTEVKYQKTGNLNTIYSALKTDVLSVEFKNGEKEVFGQSGISPQIKKNAIVEDTQVQKYQPVIQETTTKQSMISENTILTKRQYSDMFQQGKNDAKIYYKGYKGAGTGTFLASLLTGPIFGLIPAIACSTTSPSSDNLTFPSVELMRNPDYVSGYTQQAKAKKSGKVWGNYGIGTAVLLVVLASQVKR